MCIWIALCALWLSRRATDGQGLCLYPCSRPPSGTPRSTPRVPLRYSTVGLGYFLRNCCCGLQSQAERALQRIGFLADGTVRRRHGDCGQAADRARGCCQ